MQLNKKLIITGKITALTGIAVGGTNAAMSIGGVDKGVIRNPVTNEPYIPGSSLKGKMRSLLELRDGTLGGSMGSNIQNGPTTDQKFRAARLFGNAVKGEREKQRPSRVVVRDAYLDRQQVGSNFFKNADLPFTEVKTEVVIDRITSRAMPRQIERVPAGAIFDFEIVLNFFDGHDRTKKKIKMNDEMKTELEGQVVADEKEEVLSDYNSGQLPENLIEVETQEVENEEENEFNPDQQDNEIELIKDLFSAMQLLQNDYIGAAGSRGSGQIRFESETMKVEKRDLAFYQMEGDVTDVTSEYQQYFPK